MELHGKGKRGVYYRFGKNTAKIDLQTFFESKGEYFTEMLLRFGTNQDETGVYALNKSFFNKK